MPPIMGAGAFLMAEFTNISYLTIIKVALMPAVMYYLTLLVFVHYEAQKYGLVGQAKENLPRAWNVIKEGLHFIIPVAILIYVLVANYSPMMAGFVAVLSTLAASLAANAVRWSMGRLPEQRHLVDRQRRVLAPAGVGGDHLQRVDADRPRPRQLLR